MTTPVSPENGPKLIVTTAPLVSVTFSPDPGYGRTSVGENSPTGVGHTSLAIEKYYNSQCASEPDSYVRMTYEPNLVLSILRQTNRRTACSLV